MEKQLIESDFFYRLRDISKMQSWHVVPKLIEFLNTVKPKKKRTIDQNSALHVYFNLVADALNEAGLTVQETLKHQMDMEWNAYRIKDLVWKQAQKKYLGKTSTTELDKHGEIDEIYDHVNRWLATLPTPIESIPFPHDPEKKKELERETAIPKPYEGEYPEEVKSENNAFL